MAVEDLERPVDGGASGSASVGLPSRVEPGDDRSLLREVAALASQAMSNANIAMQAMASQHAFQYMQLQYMQAQWNPYWVPQEAAASPGQVQVQDRDHQEEQVAPPVIEQRPPIVIERREGEYGITTTFKIQLRRPSHADLWGLVFNEANEDRLEVTHVLPGSFFSAYNRRLDVCDDRRVRRGDLVVSVNGLSDVPRIREIMNDDLLIRIRVQRYSPHAPQQAIGYDSSESVGYDITVV